MEILIVLAFAIAEAVASDATSASCYDAREYVLAMIVPECEFRNVERQVVFADFVVTAHNPTLEQRPERFDIVGMDVSAYILVRLMVNMLVRKGLPQFLIARALICRDQIDFFRHGLPYKLRQSLRRSIIDNLASDIAFSADSSNHCGLMQRAASALFLVPTAILILSADISLVDFDFAHQFSEIVVFHRGTNPSAHIPHGFVARPVVEYGPLDLQSTHSFLALSHQEHDLEPHAQSVVGVLENRPADDAEAIAVALVARNDLASLRVDCFDSALANPVEGSVCDMEDFLISTARASDNAIGPTLRNQIGLAAFFGRELSQQFGERHGAIVP